MQNYKLTKLKNSNFDYLVISLTQETIFSFLKNIEKRIIKKCSTGKILFDLFMLNGEKNNRFLLLFFINKEFNFQNYQIIDHTCVSDEIKKLSWNFFNNHQNLLKNSALTKLEINKFLTRNF